MSTKANKIAHTQTFAHLHHFKIIQVFEALELCSDAKIMVWITLKAVY